MLRVKPALNEIYHIYNRGVDKRKIFLDEKDYFRFVHDLYEFNDAAPAVNSFYFKKNSSEVRLRKNRQQKPFVEILVFCLMPNHFHLMLRQITDDGISEFMRKIGTGYTNYFNQKYKRSGALFQGKYKFVRLLSNAHFIHLPYYIHSNPLDLLEPDWREEGIKDLVKTERFLCHYKWSSYLDYLGKKNFPSIITRSFLDDLYGSSKNYNRNILNWLKDRKRNIKRISDFILE